MSLAEKYQHLQDILSELNSVVIVNKKGDRMDYPADDMLSMGRCY